MTQTTQPTYPKGRTALLLLDPYNDFLSEGGKLWRRVATTTAAAGLHDRLKAVADAARAAGVPVFIVPHHRFAPGDLDGWSHPSPYLQASARGLVFEKGGWGGEWHPDFVPQPGDIIVKEHWASSGFANTDLDYLLKQHNITHVILIGLVANTCVEGTGRFASELGYHVTLVTDATAAFTDEALHCAHAINGPTYAHIIASAEQLIPAIAACGQ
ncbi:MAG: isochorismatase [Rhizobiales bacterium 24-66-13]|jgi:nicotinamidase-related amidase|nr:MAG: isochorismatase [Rhizobiales bacterium 32-66-11]OYY14013.1 MAG: isochorismatase [Rhizobiales bacterium 35-68-8]OYZ83103.1 MAG: isochorismatase [Rhizobiales bacterium 24-66-13]OZB12034.1 MAG: isochorismatase [Rhizobiales bacterium 39-66-18]HQS45633.1 isochorismatase family cysteine hydrolase [Xanthobacteraceae bacterium]